MSHVIEIRSHRANGVVTKKMALKELERRSHKGIRRGWFSFAKDLASEANQEILRKPKSGRVYLIRGPGGSRRRHVASAPGETHANLTGALRRSIQWKVSGSTRMEFGYGATRNDAPPYAGIETGLGRVRARPSLANAVKETEGKAVSHFEREILKEFRR